MRRLPPDSPRLLTNVEYVRRLARRATAAPSPAAETLAAARYEPTPDRTSRAGRIVVVDDEPDMVESCTRILRRAGYRVLATTDPERALALVESDRPDVLLTDLKMPGLDGMELMRRAHEIDPTLPVIMITAFGSIESAVAAIKAGAFDYLPK